MTMARMEPKNLTVVTSSTCFFQKWLHDYGKNGTKELDSCDFFNMLGTSFD